jgi:hypothetical protein
MLYYIVKYYQWQENNGDIHSSIHQSLLVVIDTTEEK